VLGFLRDVLAGIEIWIFCILDPGSGVKKAPDPQHRMYTALKSTMNSTRNPGSICLDVNEFNTCIKCASFYYVSQLVLRLRIGNIRYIPDCTVRLTSFLVSWALKIYFLVFYFQMKMEKNLLDLPVEILEQILLYLDHSQIFALRNRTIALLLFLLVVSIYHFSI
jgi:hypothetical protein